MKRFVKFVYASRCRCIVLILDGSSEHGALIWSKSVISTLVASKESSNPIFCHTCTTSSELPSCIEYYGIESKIFGDARGRLRDFLSDMTKMFLLVHLDSFASSRW